MSTLSSQTDSISRLIALEGLNGVGKSTLGPLVASELGIPYLSLIPDQARAARASFDDSPFSDAALLFYLSWSKLLSDGIEAGRYGSIVLCERYAMSTFSYFSAAGSRFLHVAKQVRLVAPSVTVLIHADEDVRCSRISQREALRRLEKATLDAEFRDEVIATIRQSRPLIEVDTSDSSPTAAASELAARLRPFLTRSVARQYLTMPVSGRPNRESVV